MVMVWVMIYSASPGASSEDPGIWRFAPSSGGDAGCRRALADRHAGIEAGKPMDDGVTRDRRVSELAMLLGSLASGEYPRRHGPGANELAHGLMHPADIEQVILLAFGQQDVLLDIVQDSIERVLGDCREEIERSLGSGDVHSLDNTPFEHRTRHALLGHKGLGRLAVAGLEQRDQLLSLAGPHLLERHIEARIGCGHRDDMLDTRLERSGADRHVAAAGSTEPIDRVEPEIIDGRLGRLLPRVIEIDPLP